MQQCFDDLPRQVVHVGGRHGAGQGDVTVEAEGTLLIPCGSPVMVDQGRYLCYRPDRLAMPDFDAFRAWILEQGAQTRGAESCAFP